ncbi:14508_t:CDS:1, partial [Racocetra fulgida]
TGGMGKEADGFFIPRGKPNVNSNGREGPDSVCRVLNISIVIINQVPNTGDYTSLA